VLEILHYAVKEGLNDENNIPAFVESLPWRLAKTAGGDSTCVEIMAGDNLLIFDAGTGIRPLGLSLMGRSKGAPIKASVLLSHTHWDHICGLPFFIPGYIPSNEITIFGVHDNLEQRIKGQQVPSYFPVPLGLGYKFRQLSTGEKFAIGDVQVETLPLKHPGDSYGYRVTYDGKTAVFATDAEYKDLGSSAQKPFIDFFRGADVLIFDSQYTMVENVEKENWGHSNTMTGIDMAVEAGVKQLVFTHHEPAYNDAKLWDILEKAKEYLEISGGGVELTLAYEGLQIKI
jgi:phosphoribosyl 1,2-cyclic phosphodiesterase